MKGGFWNIRGLNKIGRAKTVTDLISMNRLDFWGIQETKKAIITDSFLKAMAKSFDWRYVPARGTVGGILCGFKFTIFEILN
jgi:hypothetical protein